MAKLIIGSGTGGPAGFPLREGRNKVGRGPGNDLRVEDPSVSEFHCELTVLGDSVLVKDLGSTNGTWINQAPITQRALRPGDTLRLGEVAMVLEGGEAARAPSAAPARAPRPKAFAAGVAEALARAAEPAPPPSAGWWDLILALPGWLRARRVGLALALVAPLVVMGWHAAVSALGPAHLEEIAGELGSIRKFFGNPEPNHAGSRLVFTQTTEHGTGIYLRDLAAGRTELLYDQLEKLHVSVAPRFLGWSPDDQYFAYACRTPRREIVFCDGNSGKSLGNILVKGTIAAGTWLSPQRLVYADSEQALFESRQVNGRWSKPKRFRFCELAVTNQLRITGLTALTAEQVVWQQGSNLWSCGAEAAAPSSVWTSSTNELVAFACSRKARKVLLLCQDQHGQVLSSLKPRALWLTEEVTELGRIGSNDYPASAVLWLNGAAGYACATRDGAQHDVFLIQASTNAQPRLKAWELINSFAANEGQIYVIGSLVDTSAGIGRYAPTGIWRYDLASDSLSCVVSNVTSSARYARFSTPRHVLITNAPGGALACSLIPPTRFSAQKRYPLVIGSDWIVYQQAVANAGAFFASVPGGRGSWPEDIMAAYAELAKEPNIDTNRVYLLALSGAVAGADQLLVEERGRWRGAILFSPLSFPEPSKLRVSKLLIDSGAADLLLGEDGRKRMARFQDAALQAGIPVRVAMHPEAGHVYRSVAAERARVRELVRFLQYP
jgi:dipeptidyl aminopeptidase/acylaminoacyl peptidase